MKIGMQMNLQLGWILTSMQQGFLTCQSVNHSTDNKKLKRWPCLDVDPQVEITTWEPDAMDSCAYPHEVGPVADPLWNVVEHGRVALALVVKQNIESVLGKEADDVDKAAQHGVIWQVVVAAAWGAWVGGRDLGSHIACGEQPQCQQGV